MFIKMKTYDGVKNVNVAVPADLLELIAEHRGQDSWYTSEFTEPFAVKLSALANKYDVDFNELEENLHCSGLY